MPRRLAHSPADRHAGCLHILVIVNSAAISFPFLMVTNTICYLALSMCQEMVHFVQLTESPSFPQYLSSLSSLEAESLTLWIHSILLPGSPEVSYGQVTTFGL